MKLVSGTIRAILVTTGLGLSSLAMAQTSTAMLIDAGSSVSFKGVGGRIWSADKDYVGGSAYDRGAVAIANTDNDRLFQTERYGLSAYKIPIANGKYQVNLYFAENYPAITAAGQRVFDVNVEGQILSNFDIFKSAGGRNIKVVKSFNVEVKDSVLDILFAKKVQQPTIQGIEVLKVAVTSPTPTPAPTATPKPSPSPNPSPSPSAGSASAWILNHFANAKVYSGIFSTRQNLEAPFLVKDSTGCCGKYGFDVKDKTAPIDTQAGFVNVTIHDLKSTDSYGSGIVTERNYPGATVYLSNVYVEPNWPTWVDYNTTNYDGMTFDAANAVYGQDVTVKNWNADGGVDTKSQINQFVNLQIIGGGHRSMRIWKSGPHYLVNSNINNTTGGTLLWFHDCSTVKVYVYNSKFNGSSTVPSSKIQCDSGSNPNIIYLNDDPRKTGEMHPMFNIN